MALPGSRSQSRAGWYESPSGSIRGPGAKAGGYVAGNPGTPAGRAMVGTAGNCASGWQPHKFSRPGWQRGAAARIVCPTLPIRECNVTRSPGTAGAPGQGTTKPPRPFGPPARGCPPCSPSGAEVLDHYRAGRFVPAETGGQPEPCACRPQRFRDLALRRARVADPGRQRVCQRQTGGQALVFPSRQTGQVARWAADSAARRASVSAPSPGSSVRVIGTLLTGMSTGNILRRARAG